MNNYFDHPAVIRLSDWSIVKISGGEIVNFLQGQLTCDVNTLSNTQGSLAALCNNQGKVLAIIILFRKDNDFYALLPSSNCKEFIQRLAKFAMFSRTTLEDVTDNMAIMVFIGNRVEKLLESFFTNLPTQSFETLTKEQITLCNLPGNTSTFVGFCPKDQANRFEVTGYSDDDTLWRAMCVLSGLPFLTTETIGISTPHMLNLPALNAVSFSKGCYVGQEIIARTHYLGKAKRHIYLLSFAGDFTANPGDTIFAEDQEVGIIFSGVNMNHKGYALGVLQDSSTERALTCKGFPITIPKNTVMINEA